MNRRLNARRWFDGLAALIRANPPPHPSQEGSAYKRRGLINVRPRAKC